MMNIHSGAASPGPPSRTFLSTTTTFRILRLSTVFKNLRDFLSSQSQTTISSRIDQDCSLSELTKMAFSSQAGHVCNQVFIGYRREELRETFIPHLLPKLKTARINYFIDENERKGRPIDYLFTRMKESVIALALFSKRVPESKYCLEELALMKELVECGRLIVIPVFVNVTPSDVKNFKGVFGKNFREMKRKYAGEPEKVQKWEEAVEYIAGIIGESWDDRKWRNFGFTEPCNTSDMLLAGATARAVERELLEIDPNHGKTEDVGPIGNVIVSGMIAIFCGDVIPRVFLNKGSFRSFASLFLGLWVFFFVFSLKKEPPPVTPPPGPPPSSSS